MEMDLKKGEADVVIVAVHEGDMRVSVTPIWECDLPTDELLSLAASCALDLVEGVGHGTAQAYVQDFRDGA